jgi:hypothetical protein
MPAKATTTTTRKDGGAKALELPAGFAPPDGRGAVTTADPLEHDDNEPEPASVADTSGRTTFVARALRSHASSARNLANLLDGIPDTRNLVRGLRIMDRECADTADGLDGV